MGPRTRKPGYKAGKIPILQIRNLRLRKEGQETYPSQPVGKGLTLESRFQLKVK